jgi:hypothetical protein
VKRKPIEKICPEGGDPLYREEDTGFLLTAQDFAAKNECTIEEIEEVLNDRRTTGTYY